MTYSPTYRRLEVESGLELLSLGATCKPDRNEPLQTRMWPIRVAPDHPRLDDLPLLDEIGEQMLF